MNYIELIEEIQKEENEGRLILFHPKGKEEISYLLQYNKGVDSFYLCTGFEKRNDERCKALDIPPYIASKNSIGLHVSLFKGTFEFFNYQ